ncbi:MAG: hypothetical protein AAF725_10235 [Acidobacteriota bacterium]
MRNRPLAKRPWKRAARACLLATTLWAGAAFAGVELRSVTTDHSGAEPKTDRSVTLAVNGNLRINALGADGTPKNSTIFRGELGDFLVVDYPSKSFTLMDDQAIEDLKAQLEFTMLQLDRQMAELAPEQRQKMRDSLRPPEPAESKLVDTGKTAEKSGFDCRLFEVREGETVTRQIWVASWDQVEEGEQLKKSLLGFDAFTTNLSDAFKEIRSNALGGAQIFDLGGTNPFDDFQRLGGLPVHTIELEGGEPTFETRIEEVIERADLDNRSFHPPQDFKRRALR